MLGSSVGRVAHAVVIGGVGIGIELVDGPCRVYHIHYFTIYLRKSDVADVEIACVGHCEVVIPI